MGKIKKKMEVTIKSQLTSTTIILNRHNFSGTSVTVAHYGLSQRACHWTQGTRVQTRARTMDFKGDKIRSTPSFGGEVKPSVPR
jgi:hypothetical protein